METKNRLFKMTLKQQLLKWVYPALMKLKRKDDQQIISVHHHTEPPVSFYSLQAETISKQPFSFSQLRNRKVLIVNVASNCGYTSQYSELEALYQQKKDKLIVLGFPANDFKDQEPGSNEDIARFCTINYGVSFPLFQKGPVVGARQQEVYQWLTHPSANGWNAKAPTWNFCKYLIDENGRLMAFFPVSVSPLADEIVDMI